MTSQDKSELFQMVLENLRGRLNILVESALTAKEASTNEESKAENKYDTRGLEASYLASGQARRAQELKEKIFNTEKVELRNFGPDDSINVSAYVHIQVNEDQEQYIFILPAGGIEVEFRGKKIRTLSIDAPLGQQLYGMREGDDFDFQGRFFEILAVR